MLSRFRSKIRSVWRRLRGSQVPCSVHIEFYTRAGCCLCDEALETLQSARGRFPFELQIIDIDQSVELQEKYGSLVPVLSVNGRERFHGRVNRALLHRLLSAEANQG